MSVSKLCPEALLSQSTDPVVYFYSGKFCVMPPPLIPGVASTVDRRLTPQYCPAGSPTCPNPIARRTHPATTVAHTRAFFPKGVLNSYGTYDDLIVVYPSDSWLEHEHRTTIDMIEYRLFTLKKMTPHGDALTLPSGEALNLAGIAWELDMSNGTSTAHHHLHEMKHATIVTVGEMRCVHVSTGDYFLEVIDRP
jgi:hypothetical protein